MKIKEIFGGVLVLFALFYCIGSVALTLLQLHLIGADSTLTLSVLILIFINVFSFYSFYMLWKEITCKAFQAAKILMKIGNKHVKKGDPDRVELDGIIKDVFIERALICLKYIFLGSIPLIIYFIFESKVSPIGILSAIAFNFLVGICYYELEKLSFKILDSQEGIIYKKS